MEQFFPAPAPTSGDFSELSEAIANLMGVQTFSTSGMGFDGNQRESTITITGKTGYKAYIIGIRPNNYNASHYVAFFAPEPNSSGVVYFEHNLNSNATSINVYILWIKQT